MSVDRRQWLRLSGAGFLALTAACRSGALPAKAEALSWQDFLERVRELALLSRDASWDSYTHCTQTQRLLNALELDEQYVQQFIASYKNAHKSFPEIRSMHREADFMVSMLEFEKGEKIPLHNHPDMTGVIICTEGEIEIDNFDLVEKPQLGTLLKKRSELVMTPGDSGFLTTEIGNVHSLRARQFTRMIDVFCPPYTPKRTRDSRFYRKTKEVKSGLWQVSAYN